MQLPENNFMEILSDLPVLVAFKIRCYILVSLLSFEGVFQREALHFAVSTFSQFVSCTNRHLQKKAKVSLGYFRGR